MNTVTLDLPAYAVATVSEPVFLAGLLGAPIPGFDREGCQRLAVALDGAIGHAIEMGVNPTDATMLPVTLDLADVRSLVIAARDAQEFYVERAEYDVAGVWGTVADLAQWSDPEFDPFDGYDFGDL
jgi:hypothetical protein